MQHTMAPSVFSAGRWQWVLPNAFTAASSVRFAQNPHQACHHGIQRYVSHLNGQKSPRRVMLPHFQMPPPAQPISIPSTPSLALYFRELLSLSQKVPSGTVTHTTILSTDPPDLCSWCPTWLPPYLLRPRSSLSWLMGTNSWQILADSSDGKEVHCDSCLLTYSY